LVGYESDTTLGRLLSFTVWMAALEDMSGMVKLPIAHPLPRTVLTIKHVIKYIAKAEW